MMPLQLLSNTSNKIIAVISAGMIPALPLSAPQFTPVPMESLIKRCELVNVARGFFDFFLGNINGMVQTYAWQFIVGACGVVFFLAATRLLKTVVGRILTGFAFFVLFMVLVQAPPMFGTVGCPVS